MSYTDFLPPIREIRKRTIKTKNRILAIPAAPAAIPPNPKTAAIIAMIRKVTVQRSMIRSFKVINVCFNI